MTVNSKRHRRNSIGIVGVAGVVGLVLVVLVAAVLIPLSTVAASADTKYKAVLITGAFAEEYQSSWQANLNEAAAYLEQHDFICHKFYSPGAKWSAIKPVIQGANIVVYFGHGSGYEPEDELPRASKNGMQIDFDDSYPDETWQHCGSISQQSWQENVVLAPDALVVMWACYAGGKTGPEGSNFIPLDVIKHRIEDYSETFVDGDANYLSSYDFQSYLERILDRGQTLEQARDEMVYGGQVIQYEHPLTEGKEIKFNYWASEDSQQNDTSGVVAGNISMTAQDMLNDDDYEPPKEDWNTDLPPQQPYSFSWPMESHYSEYLLIANPSSQTASARVEFTKPSGNSYYDFMVPAGGRYTLDINQYAYGNMGSGEDVSLKVISDQAVVAERAIYFDAGQGRTGGHDTSGLPNLSDTWYFAEGFTAEAFDEYILLQNPSAEQVTATLSLMRDDGFTQGFPYPLEPYSRTTVHIDEMAGFEQANVSAKITSSKPIAAERAMYFNYKGFTGGHVEHGIAAPAKEWYLAEGYTAEQFDSYVLLQNPNAESATVNVEFQREGAAPIPLEVNVGPNSRYTIPVDDIGGMESTSFSTHVHSDEEVICERAMYFDYKGYIGGHCAAALEEPSDKFYFAEGYTAEQFDTYLLLQNPNTEPVEVNVTYNVDPAYGQPVTSSYTVGAQSRYTVPVDIELPAAAFGMTLSSTGGSEFMAERAMYFNYGVSPSGNHIVGGHDTTGVPVTSKVWYFAEGYTGN